MRTLGEKVSTHRSYPVREDDNLWPGRLLFARKRGLGARVTEESLNPKVMKCGVRSRVAGWDTLWPIAIAVRKRVSSSMAEGDGDKEKRGVCRRAESLSKDQVGSDLSSYSRLPA